MNRIKDYSRFAVCFAGLGYIVLWPLSTPGAGGDLFGASLLCGGGAFAPLDWLCHAPHPLRLSPALHAVGLLSAAFVVARFSLRGLRRLRLRRKPVAAVAAVEAPTPAVHLPAKTSRPRLRKPMGAPRPVKPRAHFGLRGLPQ